MATIERMLISFTLSSALPDLIASGGGLAQRSAYVRAFDSGMLGTTPVAPPWTVDPEPSRYWASTVPSKDAAGAWEKQAPLKSPDTVTVDNTTPGVTLTAERYAHPGGASVAITATVDITLQPDDAVDLHARIATEHVVTDASGNEHSIKATLHWLLDAWEEELFGAARGRSHRDPDPTIVTTVVGTSAPFTTAQATRLLRSFCYPGQPPGWTAVIPSKSGKGNDSVRMAGARSRAIWSPARALSTKDRTSLECYHANQVRGALHANQLLAVVDSTPADVHVAPLPAQELARRSTINLRWLHGAANVKVYHSHFTRIAIDDSTLIPKLNALAATFSLNPPLPTPNPVVVE